MEYRDNDNADQNHNNTVDAGAGPAGDGVLAGDDAVSSSSSVSWPSKSLAGSASVLGAAPSRTRIGGGFVWRRELEALLRCPRCQQAPMQPPVHLCGGGHSICHPCYLDLSSQAEVCASCHEEIREDTCCLEWCAGEWCEDCRSDTPGCVVCGSPLREARNLLAEELLRLLGADSRPQASPSALTIASVTSSLPDKASGDASSASGRAPAASHRPIRCPRAPCSTVVAVASLRSHFRFQHADVPVASTVCGVDTTLALVPSAVPLEMATCVALLLVTRSARDMKKARGVTALPVLTSRTRALGGPVTSADMEGTSLLVWLCDVEGASFTYSVTAAAGGTAPSSCFRGPVASLRLPQTPSAALQSLGCLALPPGLVSALTDAGAQPLRLTFVVHPPPPATSSTPPNTG